MPSNVASVRQIHSAIDSTKEIGALTEEDREERGFTRQGRQAENEKVMLYDEMTYIVHDKRSLRVP